MEPRDIVEFERTPMRLYPWTPRPYTNVTPFTVRDAATMLEILEKLREWLRVELVPHLDDTLKELVESWETNILEVINAVESQLDSNLAEVDGKISAFTTQITNQINEQNENVAQAIQDVINNSLEANDPMVAQMVNDAATATRVALDGIYANKNLFDDLVSDVDVRFSGQAIRIADVEDALSTRLSKTSLENSFKYYRNVREFGAVGDGVSDDTNAIVNALNAGDGTVFLPIGTYLVSEEIKIPSNVSILGENRAKSVIKMSDAAPRHLNTLTNEKNTRTYRNEYDSNIHISNLTLENNAVNRVSDGSEWFGNACGIMLAAVHDCSVTSVTSINAPLHCFSVDASVLPYENDQSPTFYPPSPSYNVLIRDCTGINPLVDDAFTTHYSHDIVIDNCYAEIETVDTTTGGIQNGFEIDDGSYHVTVSNSVAVGFENGFEAKGHEGVPSAFDVNFISCTARECAAGWQLSQGGTPETSHSVNIVSCRAIELTDTVNSNIGQKGASIKNYGYSGVSIRDFYVQDCFFGGILSWTDGAVVIDGVKAVNSFTATPNGVDDGFIRTTGESTARANHVIRNIDMDTAFSVGSVYRNNCTQNEFTVLLENVRATGAGQVAVSDSYFSEHRTYQKLDITGFGDQVKFRGGSASVIDFVANPPIISGTGDPEDKVQAMPGHIYLRTDGSYGDVLFVKEYGTGTSGWRAVQTEPRG